MIIIVIIILIVIFLLYYNLNYKKQCEKEHFSKEIKKFGVMWASTLNIGDDFQTLAAINLLKKNNINNYVFVDREKLKEYNGEPINLIANGWYMHDTTNFPPSNKITPIFISVYISKEEIISNNISYFKKYEPIGCRDLSTQKLFEKYNIKAYFSGCLTLCFDEYNNKNNKVYIVDPKGSNGAKLFEDLKINLDINKNDIEYINHDPYDKIINYKYDINKRLEIANNLLEKYKRAKLVITSRLHAVLPCRAFNTDVKFLHSNYHGDKRFPGLKDVINGSEKSDINNIPQKIDRKIINKFKNDIKNKFKKLVLNTNTYIPKIFHQTYKTADLPNSEKQNSEIIKKLYHDYKYILWTDEMIYDFIKNNYPQFLNFFNKLSKIQQIDIVRYFWMHHYGGVYSDLDIVYKKKLIMIIMKVFYL